MWVELMRALLLLAFGLVLFLYLRRQLKRVQLKAQVQRSVLGPPAGWEPIPGEVIRLHCTGRSPDFVAEVLRETIARYDGTAMTMGHQLALLEFHVDQFPRRGPVEGWIEFTFSDIPSPVPTAL